MVTFSRLGQHGRFGNQLFQISMLYAVAQEHNSSWLIPEWEYSKYFDYNFPENKALPECTSFEEGPYKYRAELLSTIPNTQVNNIDLFGYFQHEEYFSKYKEDIKKLFTYKKSFSNPLKEKYNYLFTKPTVAIGVRRTDYVATTKGKYSTPGSYHQLTPLYYISAIQKYFSNTDKYNFIFISDDIEWCKFHFSSLPNSYFPEFESDAEQHCVSSMCENWIIANSTFHWWAAYLGATGKVIQPSHLFAGKLLEKEGDVNFFTTNLNNWHIFDNNSRKIDLTDVTFTIPVKYDHKDRIDNLALTITMLLKYFDTNIIIGEQGGTRFQEFHQWADYMIFDDDVFHRTKMLNKMAVKAHTPIIANWDADVMTSPMQILQSVELIRHNKADMVYPYKWLFSRIPRDMRKDIFPSYDLGVYCNYKYEGVDTPEKPSYGGAVFFNRESFFEGGGENENFISFGPEDVERFHRFTKLGYKISRVEGALQHFDHYKGPDSSPSNPSFIDNKMELRKSMSQTKEELQNTVSSWTWNKQYSEEYYNDISPGATESRNEVFDALCQLYNIKGNVLDLGCGIGQWGVNIKEKFELNYKGIDFKVPKNKLIIPESQYMDHDLRLPLNYKERYDIVLCLEVAEHIDKRYSSVLVDNICDAVSKTGIIVFSAAIPFQGGRGHINEQWQSYWASLFADRGFYYSTKLRDKIINNSKIELWYRNNIIIYSKEESSSTNIDFVHPEYYFEIVKHLKGLK